MRRRLDVRQLRGAIAGGELGICVGRGRVLVLRANARSHVGPARGAPIE